MRVEFVEVQGRHQPLVGVAFEGGTDGPFPSAVGAASLGERGAGPPAYEDAFARRDCAAAVEAGRVVRHAGRLSLRLARQLGAPSRLLEWVFW
jgi:hypothetical protein